MWNDNQPSDHMGKRLEIWLIDSGMGVLNDGSGTRINRGTGNLSAPDVSIMHQSCLARADWWVGPHLGSDHFPVMIRVELDVLCLKGVKPEPRRNWKAADMMGFREEVESAVTSIADLLHGAPLPLRVRTLVGILAEADRRHIPRVHIRTQQKIWLTREVREAIKRRNSLRRQISTRREEWIEACRTANRLACEAKRRKWEEFIESLDFNSDTSRA